MGLVLDTSILIAAERGRFDFERFLLAESPNRPVYLAAITASELLQGVFRATGARRKKREAFVEELLGGIEILPFDLSSARKHAELWAKLQKGGEMIGPHDMLIAASCLALKHEVATLNVGEFQRVKGLKLAKVESYQLEK